MQFFKYLLMINSIYAPSTHQSVYKNDVESETRGEAVVKEVPKAPTRTHELLKSRELVEKFDAKCDEVLKESQKLQKYFENYALRKSSIEQKLCSYKNPSSKKIRSIQAINIIKRQLASCLVNARRNSKKPFHIFVIIDNLYVVIQLLFRETHSTVVYDRCLN